MVTNKKNNEEMIIPTYTPPKFYVYYDNKTGSIISVTNEQTDRYEYGLEVDFSEAEHFLTGNWKFIDYVVGYKRVDSNKTEIGILPRANEEYSFKNNSFEWIKKTNKDCDLTVTWNKKDQTWTFNLAQGLGNKYKNLLTPKLVFFVTLEDDFDFLIRTMYVELDKLLESDIVIPFNSDIENKIDKISISSKLVFNTYGLRIVNE